MSVTVTGADKVLRKLNIELGKIKKLSKQRLYVCGLLVKNTSVKITPVKTGNLRGSAYVRMEEGWKGPVCEIGYTAYYAPYVHEMPDSYNYTKPGTGPKFLERALQQCIPEIKKVLEKRMV